MSSHVICRYVYGLFLYQSSHDNGSFIIDIIQEAKANVCVSAVLLLYILQKHYCNKSYRFSQDLLVFEDTSEVCVSTVLLLLIV